MRDHVSPEEMHDWNRDRHGLDRRRINRRNVEWSLFGIWLLGFLMLVLLAAVEAWPSFGILNGCAAYPVECAAYAEDDA